MMRKYKVKGNFEGKKIDREILANSARQAKLKVAFASGFGGPLVGKFVKSSKVKVKKK